MAEEIRNAAVEDQESYEIEPAEKKSAAYKTMAKLFKKVATHPTTFSSLPGPKAKKFNGILKDVYASVRKVKGMIESGNLEDLESVQKEFERNLNEFNSKYLIKYHTCLDVYNAYMRLEDTINNDLGLPLTGTLKAVSLKEPDSPSNPSPAFQAIVKEFKSPRMFQHADWYTSTPTEKVIMLESDLKNIDSLLSNYSNMLKDLKVNEDTKEKIKDDLLKAYDKFFERYLRGKIYTNCMDIWHIHMLYEIAFDKSGIGLSYAAPAIKRGQIKE